MNSQVFMATTGESLIRSEQIGTEKWDTSTVLENIQINCLAVNPLDPSEVYAGTLDGILRSMDAGCNWVAAGMKGYPIKSLSVSPHQPGVVYAGSMPASIYKTEDNGGNWTELKGFQKIRNRWWWFSPADPSFKAYVQAIAISPKDPEIILAGVELGAVVRSQDGGNTWSAHLKGALRDCHSLIFHSTNGNWAYEGGGSGGGAFYPNWKGEYFNNATLSGNPLLTRDDRYLSHNWGTGSPAPGIIGDDYFSVRWTKTLR